MNREELISFFTSGQFCAEFGHTMERKDVYDDCAKFKCKFCGAEEWH